MRQTQKTKTDKSLDRAMRLYLKEISKIPLLSVEEEKELGYRVQAGDKHALQKLIESNLRFVIKIAKKYRASGLPFLDLINEGNVGLMEAARRFDPDRGVRFTSYAVWWIRQSILLYLSRAAHAFRVSPKSANILYRVAKTLAKTKEAHLEAMNRETLAAEIGVTVNELNASLEANAGTLSLDQTIDQAGELRLGDAIEQTAVPPADIHAMNVLLKEHLDRSMDILTPMEERVLRLRFGLDDQIPRTLKEVGQELDLSRERIRQIEAVALKKLRESLSDSSLATYVA